MNNEETCDINRLHLIYLIKSLRRQNVIQLKLDLGLCSLFSMGCFVVAA